MLEQKVPEHRKSVYKDKKWSCRSYILVTPTAYNICGMPIRN